MVTLIATLIFAVVIHEVGHILAILLTHAGQVQGIVICRKGIGIRWEPYAYEPLKRSAISLSGSVVNIAFAVIFYASGLEVFGLSNLVFGAVNLMPLPGADGLRAFSSFKEAISYRAVVKERQSA